MTIQEQFQLRFYTIEDSDGDKFYSCEYMGNNSDYHFVASILGMLDPIECEYINEEIEKAQNGLPFEQEHGPDTLSD